MERQDQLQAFEHGSTDLAPYRVSSLNNYFMALNNLLQETPGKKTPQLQHEKGRTIYISYGDIFGKPGKVTEREKNFLFKNGEAATEKFLNDLENSPAP